MSDMEKLKGGMTDMDKPVRIALFGVGVVSSLIAKALLQKQGTEIIAAVDADAAKIGRDLGDVLDLSHKLGVTVRKDLDEISSGIKPDIVIHATHSDLKRVGPQISACIKKGFNVISTCEELVYPYHKNKAIAEELDRLAKAHGVSILGSGINPGFLMDTLPIVLTAPCLDVRKIRVTRMMNSGKRRIPFQKKVGTGLTAEEFRQKIEKKEITGHVGLDVSIAMIAGALGMKLEEIVELPPEPVLSDRVIETSYATVRKGYVSGLKSVAFGVSNGEKVVELEFISSAGVEEEFDSVELDGVPNIRMRIEGGVHGDTGTVAMIINAIPKVINASPGLHTMIDLPIPSTTLDDMRKFLRRNKN